jgi:hypothetical protein
MGVDRLLPSIGIALVVAGMAARIGYLDERVGEPSRRGSIAPGWILHGGSNAIVYAWAATIGW